MLKTWMVAAVCLLMSAGAHAADTIGTIKDKELNTRVTITGKVTSFNASRSERAPNKLVVKDATGEISVAIWPDVMGEIAEASRPKKDADVTISGVVREFQGTKEVHVRESQDVKLAGGASAGTAAAAAASAAHAAAVAAPAQAPAASGGDTAIGTITEAQKGNVVTIAGEVMSVREPNNDRAPYVVKVRDASGTVDVVYWKDTADKMTEPQKPTRGAMVRVKGKVDDFRGTIQIRVEDATGIQTRTSSPSASWEGVGRQGNLAAVPAAVPATLGEVATLELGKRVEVAGGVKERERLRTGQRLVLADDSGEASVLLWDTAVGVQPAAGALGTQHQVKLQGTIREAEGTRYVVVTEASEVVSVSQ